ncbi:hypothetical protein DSCO28_62040 [Desulfosarcina ovata subsp. sediminis]|uniref:superoxide dismutase n=1 Tax=Desulfosarcina ovata subsp. sediminis TaxID=885957 RepID=A0A5K7ZZK4_9BACT|nr:superoxide dismutase [Desulfosarcina ovata]BBO85638.1 hypothetical protein DSCO28_62040 [Desulfosarcina ovata subsp. sediminis]
MASHPVKQRRFVLRASLLSVCILAALFMVQCGIGNEPAHFVKEPLPYTLEALSPYISAQAMDLHYNKHYAGYVKKAIALTRGTDCGGKSPEEVIRMTSGDEDRQAIFNNAAQAYNHAFFFNCLTPEGGGAPEGLLAEMIDGGFGSFENFKKAFVSAAGSRFGSGWAWLVLEDGQPAVFTGSNADTPIAHGLVPLLAVDVWEHAYYLDYQNRRAEFVETVLDHLVNWDFVASQLPEMEAQTEQAETDTEPEVATPAEPQEAAPVAAAEEGSSHADEAHHG